MLILGQEMKETMEPAVYGDTMGCAWWRYCPCVVTRLFERDWHFEGRPLCLLVVYLPGLVRVKLGELARGPRGGFNHSG